MIDSSPPLQHHYGELTRLPPQIPTLECNDLPSGGAVMEEYCQLPLIDLSCLNSTNERERLACAEAICRASSEWGFFQVVNHGISPELVRNMRREQVKLFQTPFDKKATCGVLNNSYRWGTPTATCPKQFSWCEAFHIPLSRVSEQACYGEFSSLREVMMEFAAAMSKLSRVLAGVLAENLGHPRGVFENIYEVGGLQLMKDSKWVAVNPNQDALIVNIGDLLQDHVTVRESVVDVLSEISKYCDIYLMERTLDDESGKLADIGFTFQPLDQVERINFKKYELEALFSLKGGKMEWRFRELLRVEKFCYLLNVPNSSEVICPPPVDDVNDSAELFWLNRRKVLAMIQGCKIRPVGLVRTTMDTRCGGLGFGVASEFNGVVLVMGLVGAWLVLQVGCEVSGVGSGGAV
ncbi:hypothetical protein NC653_025058 [Populus alba x Populus x berolinensis]|uniref:Uncharacterized protein n=1 Tax=Populus alba x Populus x berolinensis TaxID=444605 RepID=A0AAD6MAN0_9ROSI|nr:hypothetical protein NC653_025058 [Populus alba x Populus x berolinensis]